MLDRALSEAQSHKELRRKKQAVCDDITCVSTDSGESDSECHEKSRCGLTGCMHEMLLGSGKFFYDCFGKPRDEATVENIVTAAEFGEEGARVFCCVKSGR